MAMTSEDWAKIWGPLATAFVASLVTAMPEIIKAIIGAFSSMSSTEKVEVIKAVAGAVKKPDPQ